MNLIPNFYRPPLCLPLNWHDEVSGRLRKAIHAYLDNRIDGTPILAEDVLIVCEYMRHYINAPCWDNPEFIDELLSLRDGAKKLTSPQEIADWIRKAMEIGLDPL